MSVALVTDNANPVRKREPRVVQVRYTDFACVRTRLHTLFDPTPQEAVGKILREVDLEPSQLRVKAQELGDVAVFRRMPADVVVELKPGVVMPIAFVEGLTESEIASALAAHAAGAQ